MSGVMLTRFQAYEVVQEYLAEFTRQAPNATLGTVLSDLDPHSFVDGQPVDPAVPWDWANAAAVVAARSAGPLTSAGPELSEEAWLPSLFPFLGALWPVLGQIPVRELPQLLTEADAPIRGSGLTPWQHWVNATKSILGP